MHLASPRPALLLLAVAGVLSLLVGLVGSGGREISRPRVRPAIEPWVRAEESPILRAPDVLPPLEAEAPAAALRPAATRARAGAAHRQRARLVGFVTRPEGEPASGARVVLGRQQARCDQDGRFELVLAADAGSADLVAFEPGHEPALRPAFGASLAASGESQVRLVLGPETLALSGSVVGTDGEPLAGWTVELDGLDPLRDAGLREPVRTDGEGRFRLADVPAGVHVVRAWKARRELAFRSAPIGAGENGLTIVADPLE